MEITVERKWKNRKLNDRIYCVDRVYVDGVFVCNAMEDKDWGWTKETPVSEIKAIKSKNKSKTAIPTGRYRITIDIVSPKFHKYQFYREFCNGRLPRLIGVTGFEGILIHCGVNETSSAGCIIVGYNTYVGGLTNSRKAFKELYTLIRLAKQHNEDIWITIK